VVGGLASTTLLTLFLLPVLYERIFRKAYQLIAKIPTALGARTPGYFGAAGKGFDRFYLAVQLVATNPLKRGSTPHRSQASKAGREV
jgi:hypothetical protein